MPKMLDLSLHKAFLRFLFYGESGSGKTSAIAQLCNLLGATYVMNFDPEDNLRMIAAQLKVKDMAYEQYMLDMEGTDGRGYESFLANLIALKKFPEGEFPFKLVVVENGNELHKCILKYTARCKGHETPTLPDYGLAHERFKQRIRELNELPCHTIMTFHQQIEKDEFTGFIIGRILLGGKMLPDEVPPMFNAFLRTFTMPKPGAKPEYKVAAAKDTMFPAADKTGALDAIEDADFRKIWAKISTKLTI